MPIEIKKEIEFSARIASSWRAKNGQVLASNAKPPSACEFRLSE
jgi:hypothetical protein